MNFIDLQIFLIPEISTTEKYCLQFQSLYVTETAEVTKMNNFLQSFS